MNIVKTALALGAAILVSAAPAWADDVGRPVTGVLALGPNDGFFGPHWNPAHRTLDLGRILHDADGANADAIRFSGAQLAMADQAAGGAGGWELSFMAPAGVSAPAPVTFAPPAGFSNLSPAGGDFGPAPGIAQADSIAFVDWVGAEAAPAAYPAVARPPAPSLTAVPEPAAWALLIAGLGLLGATALRGRAAQRRPSRPR